MLRGRLEALRGKDEGQIAWGFALTILVIFMVFALAFDAGLWYFDHRTAQNQVDAAAHAGALSLVDGVTATTAADEWFERNGIGDPAATACPADAEHPSPWWIEVEDTDSDGFDNRVNVCQRRESGLVFSSLSGLVGVQVSAKASAEFFEYPLLYSLMAMSEGKCPAFDVSGQGQIEVIGGATYTRSDCDGPQGALGVSGTGNAQLISAGNDVVGDYDPSDPISPEPTQANWIDDPFYFLNQPTGSPPVYTSAINQNNNGTTVLSPGIYERSVRISNGTIEFEEGIYVFYEGFKQTGGTVTSNGAEVLLYSTCDPPPCNGDFAGDLEFTGGELNLTGYSDVYNILFWVDRTSKYNPGGATVKISGQGDVFLQGITYALSSDCHFTGQADIDVELNMSVICDTIDFSGQGNIIIEYDPLIAPVTREIAIVE